MPPRKKLQVSATPDVTATESSIRLLSLPVELFELVLDNFQGFPSETWLHVSYPDQALQERTLAFRALSQTCKALRQVMLHRLWENLETIWVPVRAKGIWHKYVMQALKRKADAVVKSDVRHLVRTLTVMFTNSNATETLASFTGLLKALPNLQKLHVLSSGRAKEFNKAVSGLLLPTVKTLYIPDTASGLLRACPNVTHIRNVQGLGSPILGPALKGLKFEVIDGKFWWDNKEFDRFFKHAKYLREIEFAEIPGNHCGPWKDCIEKLGNLSNISTIRLTYGTEPVDLAAVEAARKVLRESKAAGQKHLVVKGGQRNAEGVFVGRFEDKEVF
ncbi:hypothetical protein C8J56DRAFT_472806 [Mycena floridula]|nr:hypothetical protein C8J56DRAFT_472806 [Mycena floridula]